MRESDDELMRHARVYVDTRGGALKEAGDLIQAMAAGALAEADIVADLHELARGTATGRTNDLKTTVFKSVGASLEDLAAAIERALKNAPALIGVVTSQRAVSSDAQKGLGFVPDYQALTTWDDAERKRRGEF